MPQNLEHQQREYGHAGASGPMCKLVDASGVSCSRALTSSPVAWKRTRFSWARTDSMPKLVASYVLPIAD